MNKMQQYNLRFSTLVMSSLRLYVVLYVPQEEFRHAPQLADGNRLDYPFYNIILYPDVVSGLSCVTYPTTLTRRANRLRREVFTEDSISPSCQRRKLLFTHPQIRTHHKFDRAACSKSSVSFISDRSAAGASAGAGFAFHFFPERQSVHMQNALFVSGRLTSTTAIGSDFGF